MDIKVEKEFKNGKKIIAVTRTVTTYFKVEDISDDEGVEVTEKNTVDELRANTFTGLPQEFWDKAYKVCTE